MVHDKRKVDKLQNMFRQLAVLTVVVICLSERTAAKTDTKAKDNAKALKTLQEFVSYIYEGEKFDDNIYNAGKSYDLKALFATNDATYREVVAEFRESYESGMLPRGSLFSPFYSVQLAEAKLIFRVFYYAPSIWKLIYTAIWASIHLNEYQFRYALRMTLAHRKDTTSIQVPPVSQTLPEYFYNSDFMKQVYDFKIGLNNRDKSNEVVSFTAEAKYTNWYTIDTTDCEYNLTYFMEDIGFSNWYFSYNQIRPSWMSSKEYQLPDSERRGEIYTFIETWILSRYNFERMSNNLDEVLDINWDRPVPIGYSPSMNYPNGMQFPRRKEQSLTADAKNKYLHQLKDVEERASAAIDSGYALTPDSKFVNILNQTGINILGNIIQGNGDSINRNYYSSIDEYGRNILGFSPERQTDYQILPSALDYIVTSLRDPAFYRLCKKIGDLIIKFKRGLPTYSRKELDLNEIKIDSVSIVEKHVTTYFEWFDTVISKFRFDCGKQSAIIKARQYRLNHKPVTFNLKITSQKDVTVIVRIFIGPEFTIFGKADTETYKHYYLMDYFVKDLKKGTNIIQESVNSTRRATLYSFPDNLIFPKGTSQGLPVNFFFHVSEFKPNRGSDEHADVLIRDSKPLGFPMDRPLPKFSALNTAVLVSTIYHI